MRVRYTQRAVDDLTGIFAYLDRENPLAAVRIVGRIESVAAELGVLPGWEQRPTSRAFSDFPS